MGPSQSSHSQKLFSFHEIFPRLTDFKPENGNTSNGSNICMQSIPYRQQSSGKCAKIRKLNIQTLKKNSIDAYFNSRKQLKKSAYILELFDYRVVHNRQKSSFFDELEINNSASSNLCLVSTARHRKQQQIDHSTLWLLAQSSNLSLQDQILNRVNKRPFEEIELWSVISSSVFGAISLLENGFKQPVLSPKGIALSKEGIIKVAEWELVSRVCTSNSVIDEGQVIFQKFNQIPETNKTFLNQLLLNYYWAPEGLRSIQQFVTIGTKQAQSSVARSARFGCYSNNNFTISSAKFQIFSLGMTIITMCLRNCYYRINTFSEKYLAKLLHQAVQIRKIEGKDLSEDLKQLISAMIKWDPLQRISYSQLRDAIIKYLNENKQIRDSPASIKTYKGAFQSQTSAQMKLGIKSRTSSQSSNLSSIQLTNLQQNSFNEGNSFTLGETQSAHSSNQGHKNMMKRHVQSTLSSCTGQGSGMVQQGSGDDDSYLQLQKDNNTVVEKSIQEQQSYSKSSSPITHRTDEQLNLVNNRLSSPFQRMNQQSISNQKCPVSSPNGLPNQDITEKSIQNNRGQNDEKLRKYKKNQVYLQSPDQSPQSSKKKPLQIQPLNIYNINSFSISKQNFMINSISNRGSYRSFNKEPPNIKSARQRQQVQTAQVPFIQKDFLKRKENFQQISQNNNYQYSLHGPKLKQLKKQNLKQVINIQSDQQDKENQHIDYNFFAQYMQGSLEKEFPDIFQSFQGFQSQQQSNASVKKAISLAGSQVTDRSYKIQIPNININNSQLVEFSKISQPQQKPNLKQKKDQFLQDLHKKYKISKNSQVEEQFMTFNKKEPPNQSIFDDIKIANSYVPSKWNKTGNKARIQKTNSIKNQEQNLFTDQKLMQYIRSPISTLKNNQIIENNNEYHNFTNFSSTIEMNKNSFQNYRQIKQKDEQIFLKQKSSRKMPAASPIALLQMKMSYEDFSHKINTIDKNEIINSKIEPFHQNYQSLESHSNKIVKQKAARGYYEGEKKNGLRSGYGIFYYNQGGKYRGNWLNNQMHGKGTLQYADGRVAYQGEWCNDQLHGKGILYNQSPNFVNHQLNYKDLDEMDQCWIFYEGMFEHDDKCGMGLLVLSNQQQFVGQFKDDMAEGMGEFLTLDGTVVKGIWHKNKLIQIFEPSY